MKVLIIDDYRPIGDLLVAWCQSVGHRSVLAGGGEEGLAALAAEGADLVLIDVDMPGLGGVEVCRRIRRSRDWGDVPVVLMSGRLPVELNRLVLSCGASTFVTKPFDWNQLEGVLRWYGGVPGLA